MLEERTCTGGLCDKRKSSTGRFHLKIKQCKISVSGLQSIPCSVASTVCKLPSRQVPLEQFVCKGGEEAGQISISRLGFSPMCHCECNCNVTLQGLHVGGLVVDHKREDCSQNTN
ncbi:hypothetical protein EYF80_005980 [Liparis tanakae]|uniref:Uncharacterized protein n=1 Tax=Liparis tanakae TaxID=230148 RepID=A0A4Z2J1U8_9TELE|nr:hypothetical protein EYF80_005980 [Liparis tanakae]